MAVLEVIKWPAEILATKSKEISQFDDELIQLVIDMHETMLASGGIGLAANQVNQAKRIITINIPWGRNRYSNQETIKEPWHDKSYTFINPIITKKEGTFDWQEGCLSFPMVYESIERAQEIWVDALDEKGRPFSVHATDLFSVCIQHEIDHIDGIVFIDHLPEQKRDTINELMIQQRDQDK